MTREDILTEARTWIGTPWRHGQMTKGAGADCLGFLAGIALALGYVDARRVVRDEKFRAYGRLPDTAMLDEVCDLYLDPIDRADARAGDVLRMTPARGVYAQHFALVTDVADRPVRMIHCTNAYPRCVTEHAIDADWWSRVRRAYTWRGLA